MAVTTMIVCFCPRFEPMLRFILKIDALIFIDTPELQRKGWQKKVCKLQSLSRFQAQMIANTHPGFDY